MQFYNTQKIVRTLWLGVGLFIAFTARAQQPTQYTQFMFNPQVINPAYAGFTGDRLNATAVGQWQWTGVDGAPTTQTLALDTRLKDKKVGLGFVLNSDEVTIFNTTSLQINYAYQLIHSTRQKLSLALSGSFHYFSARYSDLSVDDPDQTLAANASDWSPNVGFGAYYTVGNWRVGVSIPLLMKMSYKDHDATFFKQRAYYLITAGYTHDLSPTMRLEPNVLVEVIQGAPLTVDLNVLLWMKDVLGVGVGYRVGASMHLFAQCQATERIKVGYAFDTVTGQDLSGFTHYAHELMLSYRVKRE